MDSTYGDWPARMADDVLRMIGEPLASEAKQKLRAIFRVLRKKLHVADKETSELLCHLVADGYALNEFTLYSLPGEE